MYIFETMRLSEGKIPRRAYHKARILQSAQQLSIPLSEVQWEAYLADLSNEYPTGTYRLKVMADEAGQLTHQCVDLPKKQRFTAKAQLMRTDYPKWQFVNKTSHREHVDHLHETDVVLFYNLQGKVLEFDIGNVLIKEGSHYYTPYFDNDFLKGCMRAQLLDEGKVIEKDYTIDELKEKLEKHEVELFLINSLREVAEIQINL
ncbi:aminotransferase class IV [Staphylococcus simulans]